MRTLARIIHEYRREAAETEAWRGFSQVRATQADLRSVEETEREKPRQAMGSAAAAGRHELSGLEAIGIDSKHASPPSVFSRRPSISEVLPILTEMMRAKDPALLEHGRRTAQYAMGLGQAAGVSARDLIDLYYAALLHDIGKVTLPDDLLQRTEPLTHQQYVLMQCHPRDGARLLAAVSCLRRAAVVIAHHHEHWDGSGYPYGLRGAFIPLGSRILAVADRFDALCSERAGAGEDPRIAMKLLRMVAGSQLDPMLVGCFLHRADDESGAVMEVTRPT